MTSRADAQNENTIHEQVKVEKYEIKNVPKWFEDQTSIIVVEDKSSGLRADGQSANH